MTKPPTDYVVEHAREILSIVAAEGLYGRSVPNLIDYAFDLAQSFENRSKRIDQEWEIWQKDQNRLFYANRKILRKSQTHCGYCETLLDGERHTDHIDPARLGGSDELYNLVDTCAKCNLAKGGKPFWEFLETMNGKKTEILKRLNRYRKKLPRRF